MIGDFFGFLLNVALVIVGLGLMFSGSGVGFLIGLVLLLVGGVNVHSVIKHFNYSGFGGFEPPERPLMWRCDACDGMISSEAQACPHCGHPNRRG